jgi:hypothetical protein
MESLNVNAHSATGVDAATSWQTMATGMLVETAVILSSRKLKNSLIIQPLFYAIFLNYRSM